MSSNVFAANVYYAGNVIVSQTLNVPTITAQAIYGTSNTSTAAYVPQDFSSSGLNIPAYVVSNTATVANTVAYSSFGPFVGEGSVYFPGGSAPRISFGVQPQFAYNWTSFDFTMECFVYHTSRPYDQRLLSRDGDILMYVSQSNYPNQLVLYSAGITSPTSGSFVGGTVPLNQWNHLAVSYIASTSTVYLAVNGAVTVVPKVTGTFQYTGTNNTNIDYWVGISGTNIGYLSNFRFIRGAALYTTSFTPPTGPLQPIQGTTQAGLPYGTVLLLRNAPAPGRVLTSKFGGANSSGVLSFPPAAMTTYATTLNSGYGQGTYVASASTEYTPGAYYAWYAFDKSSATQWGGSYSYTTNVPYGGTVRTVDVNGTSYAGEWLQIQKPSSIVLSSYSILPQSGPSNTLSAWYVLGSRDGTNWFLIDQRSGATWTSGAYNTYQVQASQAFSYFRIVINIVSNGTGIGLPEWTLNGTIEGPSVSADGRLGVDVTTPTQALEVAGSAVVAGTLSAGNPLMFRNRIINGDVRVDQRGSASSAITNTAAAYNYAADRFWVLGRLAGKISCQQSSVVPTGMGFVNSFLITSLSAYTTVTSDFYGAGQYIEGYNIADLMWGTSYGVPATLSFWVRSSVTGSFTFNVVGGNGNQPSYSVQYTISNANTWQQIVIVIPPPPSGYTVNFPSTNTAGCRLWWDLGSSDTSYATSAPGTWVAGDKVRVSGSVNFVATNGATLYITGVQLEKGSVATPFEVRPFGIELSLCQRYYVRFTGDGSFKPLGIATAINTVSATGIIVVPTSMRSQPTIIDISSSSNTCAYTSSMIQGTTTHTTNDVYLYSANLNLGFTTIGGTGNGVASLTRNLIGINLSNGSGLTAGGSGMLYMSVGKYIGFSAEL